MDANTTKRRRGRPVQQPLARLQLKLPVTLLEALKDRALRTDVPMSRIITRLLRQELKVGE